MITFFLQKRNISPYRYYFSRVFLTYCSHCSINSTVGQKGLDALSNSTIIINMNELMHRFGAPGDPGKVKWRKSRIKLCLLLRSRRETLVLAGEMFFNHFFSY